MSRIFPGAGLIERQDAGTSGWIGRSSMGAHLNAPAPPATRKDRISTGYRAAERVIGGITFRDDPRRIKLSDLGLRVMEKFFYKYNFNDQWRHLIRVEAILPSESDQRYPVCIGGKRAAPPKDCGGTWAFMERRDEMPCEVCERFWRPSALASTDQRAK